MIRVVRHAKVTVSGVCYGQSDVPTTMGADEAADVIAAQLGGAPIDAIVTSPTLRTRPVAEALAARMNVGVRLEVEPRIAEISMGLWEGRTFADIERHDTARYHRWMERWQVEAPPGGEALPSFVARVSAWHDEAKGRSVLAICHAGVIRSLRAILSGAAYADVAGDPVDHLVVETLRNLR